MDKNNEYVTLADCLVFCNILDYKISERQLRRIIDTEDIETLKSSKILVNKKQFSNLILEKYRKKSKKLNNKVREALKYQRLRLFVLLLDPHLTHTLKIYVFCKFFPNFFFLFFCYVSINTHCCF